MFLDDLLHHGQPQAGAAGLRGDIGFECTLENFFRETGAIVHHLEANGTRLAVIRSGGLGRDDGQAVRKIGHRVERVLHQVVDDLAQLAGVAGQQRQLRREFGTQPAAFLLGRVQAQHLDDQRVQVQRLQPGRGQPRVVAELVDQRLHRLHLGDDGAHRAHQHLLVGAGQLGLELVLQPLGRELDRRQRILDLVGQPARHLGPGDAALRDHHVGDVVEDQQPCAFGQQRAAHQQRLRRLGAAELERFLPVRVAGRLVAGVLAVAQMGLEARQHRGGEGLQAGQAVDRMPRPGRGVEAENACGAGVDGVDAAIGLEDDHARAEVVQDGLQVRLGALGLGQAALHQAARVGELLGHVGEGGVRPPSSSREAKTAVGRRSPRATWRTPSASITSGRPIW